MTVAEDVELLLLTREQAARRCGVGLNKIDQWVLTPGFPVIREGQHFVRIHAGLLDHWLAARAESLNPPLPLYPTPQPADRPRRSAPSRP